DQSSPGPFKIQRAFGDLFEQLRSLDHLPVMRHLLAVAETRQALADRIPAFAGSNNLVSRIGRPAIPVAIEIPGDFRNDLADGQYVEVNKERGRAGAEVLIADVAPAENADTIVDGKALVVHSAIEAEKVEAVGKRLQGAQVEGVPQPHFDIGM